MRSHVHFHVPASILTRNNLISHLISSKQQVSRADVLVGGFLAGAAALTGGLALPSLASAEEAATATDVGPAPTNFGLSKEYYKDAAQMLQHMKCVGRVGWAP